MFKTILSDEWKYANEKILNIVKNEENKGIKLISINERCLYVMSGRHFIIDSREFDRRNGG